MRTPNKKAILAACELYIKYRGRNHRRIEADMRALGFHSFTRRVLYDRRQNGQLQLGWIRRFNFIAKRQAVNSGQPAKKTVTTNIHEIPRTETVRATLSPKGTNNIARGQAEGRNPGYTPAESPLPVGEQQTSDIADFKAWLKKISPNMTWDWKYQQLIYDKLKQITDGTTKRLMLFLPPRHGKSELVTVRYPAWRLQQDPSLNVIIGSYNQRLANRFSRRVRDVLSEPPALAGGLNSPISTSDGQNTPRPSTFRTESKPHLSSGAAPPAAPTTPAFGHPSSGRRGAGGSDFPRTSRTRLNTVAEWETASGGGVRAVGVGGGITGFGAKLVIIDDPIKSRAEAESKTYRERVWDWFNDDIYTRLEPDAAIILIQTRWHEDDLSGRLLKQMSDGGEHWDVISLPALAARIDNGQLIIDNEKPQTVENGQLTTDGKKSIFVNKSHSRNESSPKLRSSNCQLSIINYQLPLGPPTRRGSLSRTL